MRNVILLASVLPLSLVLSARSAPAQCPDWDARFSPAGTDAPVRAMTIFDDGTGSALYMGGNFYAAGPAGANCIARWNGTSWSPLGGGVTGGIGDFNTSVNALASFDDGSGPALYAGGDFSEAGGITAHSIARWNGSAWSPCGSIEAHVFALAVFDDGDGPALYAGGDFIVIDGHAVSRIVKWNGSTWISVGGGVSYPTQFGSRVNALAVFDDGSGPALYAGGYFTVAGGGSVTNIAKWNGSTWAPVGLGMGGGTSSKIWALTVFDDGSGPALFAGGSFPSIGGTGASNIARWNGSTWTALGPGASATVTGLGSFDDGSGQALYAGGYFTSAGGAPANRIARWNGSAWSALGSGVTGGGVSGSGTPFVAAILAFDSGSGPMLYAGGEFEIAGAGGASRVGRWNGSSWSVLTAGLGLSKETLALATYDDGSGPAIYTGGRFSSAGTTIASHVAKLQGSSWASLDKGTNGIVSALVAFDSGSGSELYAGGTFTTAGNVSASNIARWNGAAWSALSTGVNSTVNALAVFDDGSGPALYATGQFTTAGGMSANRIAKWDGSSWSALGSGLSSTGFTSIAFDDGSGPALYVGGTFTSAGGVPANHIAKWNGSSWSSSGSGWSGVVLSFGVSPFGPTPTLYAGEQGNLIHWSGSGWTWDPPGLGDVLLGLQAFNDGTGTQMYVCGPFTTVGATPVNCIARYDGATWSSVLGGLHGPSVYSEEAVGLLTFDDGADGAPDLYVVGSIARAQGRPTCNFAQYHGCPTPGVPYCAGDGTLATACPCANVGQIGHGCDNSAATGGALLSATGSASPDSVVLVSDNELPSSLSIFLQGDASLSTPAVFGDGLRCVGGHLKRLYAVNASNGQVSAPSPSDPKITARSAALGDPIAPGSTRYYQVYYRDPNLAFCPQPTGGTFNVSGGLSIQW